MAVDCRPPATPASATGALPTIVIGALVFLSDREWRAGDNPDPDAMAATFDAYVDAVVPALSGHWEPRHGEPRHGESGHGDPKPGDATSSTTVPMARPSAT
jgi:hypothetical protein